MLEEYAIVRLKRVVPTIPLPAGSTGTILMVHSRNPPVYEVGFDPSVGESLGTFTVDGADLEEVIDR
jgi:hypothetical protein